MGRILLRINASESTVVSARQDDAIKEWDRRQFGKAIVLVAATRIAEGMHKFYTVFCTPKARPEPSHQLN
jgi:hypothetical protein